MEPLSEGVEKRAYIHVALDIILDGIACLVTLLGI